MELTFNPPIMRISLFSAFFLIVIYSLSFSFSLCVASDQCLSSQQTLLLQLKKNLTFNCKYSTYLDTWNQSVDCCLWGGVTCNNGHVIGLDLTGKSISSELDNSSSHFPLSYLNSLNLAGNDFNLIGIPSDIGKFTDLRYLSLANVQFTGQIPLEISHLTRLEVLDLSFNEHLELKNTNFNTFVQNFSKLTALFLDGVSISADDNTWCPTLSSSLPNLQLLTLVGCNLSGPINCPLQNLSHLSVLDLSFNFLDGNIPISLFSLSSLLVLRLSNNQFSGQLNEFFNISSFLLEELDLSSNNLKGSIPMSIFELQSLNWLSLSSNNFFGSLQLQRSKLSYLDLSHNHLLKVENSVSNISLWSFPQIANLSLASNNLKKIPNFLKNLTSLYYLDLSNNQIDGEIPNWISNLTLLEHLDLSHNLLVSLERLPLGPNLVTLDLHSNRFQGQLPTKIATSILSSPISSMHCTCLPNELKRKPRAIYLSDNMFYGRIPETICNISILRVLDLSKNSFSGTLPQCLLKLSSFLGVMNLRENKLNGIISNVFPNDCELQALILNGNQLEGELPKSLANCRKLEILDIGNNNIKGTFPFYLEKGSILKVLILRSNKFYGSIPHLRNDTSWLLLQIVDIALNNFSGRFPKFNFSTWTAMIENNLTKSRLHYLQYDSPSSGPYQRDLVNTPKFHYRLAITITSKGSSRILANILTAHTAIDFSCNNFDGPIPKEIGELKLLFALNLSHNAFTGKIPSSLEGLSNLESLDLSSNNLFGKIPIQIAYGLISLSALNLSFNQLEGQIPFIRQFATFENSSFEGNKKLCGFPLSVKCMDEKPPLSPPTSDETHLNSKAMIQWNYISIELGFIFGMSIVIGPLMFWKKWRVKYYRSVDNILLRIFPRLLMGRSYRQRRTRNN